MDVDLYVRLIREAMHTATIQYGQTGWHARTMGPLLDEINRYEARHGRPMLSSIVVLAYPPASRRDGNVGVNFWQCAEDLGRWKPGHDKAAFLAKEREAVWKTWEL